MTKNYVTPLTVSIANKSNNTQYFVPHMENQNFPVKVGGQVSFTVNNSEVGLYYEKQLDKNLSFAIAESNNVVLECGSGFDLATFEKGASFSAILESKEENTYNYSIIGTLPYSAETPSLGMPAGNRFIIRLANPTITERNALPSGKICVVDVQGGSHNDYTKSAFETDGSLIVVLNAVNSSKITVSIDWVEDVTTNYIFTFKDIKLGAEGETLDNVENINIILPTNITLEAIENVKFIPYHENFLVDITKGDKLVLEVKQTNEALYYLLQNNKNLKVTL
jgi:hypothetical protein